MLIFPEMMPFAENYDLNNERHFVERAQAGSQDAVAELVSLHQRFIFNVACKLVHDKDQAKDLTQDVLIKMITRLSQFKFKSTFRTWLYRIVFNEFLQSKQANSEVNIRSFDQLGPVLDNLYDKESMSEEEHRKYNRDIFDFRNKCTSSMLLCLDRQQRFVFTLGAIFNLKSNLAAKIMGITPENFRKQLSRAKADLFQFMNNKCGLINPENPCRCHKKVKGFIRDGIIDPGTNQFSKEALATIGALAPKKNEQIDQLMEKNYLNLYHDQPYQSVDSEEQFVYSLLDNPQVREVFSLN